MPGVAGVYQRRRWRSVRVYREQRCTASRKGDAGVSMSSYAAVIFALGLIERLGDAFDARHDAVGLGLEAEQMPKNIVNKRYDQ